MEVTAKLLFAVGSWERVEEVISERAHLPTLNSKNSPRLEEVGGIDKRDRFPIRDLLSSGAFGNRMRALA